MEKIKMTTPLVEMDGDEMTRVLWKIIKEELILPFVDLKTEYYDLGLPNRDATQDQVTLDAALANKKYGVAVKCATITPNAQRVEEYHLHQMWKSPNGTIRAVLDGTVFRAPIMIDSIRPVVKNWTKPITIARHAYGDVYKCTEFRIPGPGRAELIYTGDDGSRQAATVYNFECAGVLQGQYNKDTSIYSFARSCFNYALESKQDLWFGAKDTISKKYDHTFKDIFQEVYDAEYKAKFEAAGITTLPKTPDEFLDDLQKIKDYDPSIDPLYTNYAAGWTMTAWDAYTSGGATGDPNWMNITMPQTKDPFQKGILGADDMGPYAVYYILYEAVKRGLTEADPTTTDWEGSKPRINNGQIGAMVLGSWAIVQMQAAGDHADDIGYMPFPITVKGTQYASAGADYCYGVNKNTTDDKKLAAMLYIKWLTESSNFAYDQGGVPVLKSQEYPDTLKAFDGIDLVEDAPAPAELADLATEVQQEAELMLNADQTHVMRVVEAGINGDETLDDIVADWNAAWDAAVDACAPQ